MEQGVTVEQFGGRQSATMMWQELHYDEEVQIWFSQEQMIHSPATLASPQVHQTCQLSQAQFEGGRS